MLTGGVWGGKIFFLSISRYCKYNVTDDKKIKQVVLCCEEEMLGLGSLAGHREQSLLITYLFSSLLFTNVFFNIWFSADK